MAIALATFRASVSGGVAAEPARSRMPQTVRPARGEYEVRCRWTLETRSGVITRLRAAQRGSNSSASCERVSGPASGSSSRVSSFATTPTPTRYVLAFPGGSISAATSSRRHSSLGARVSGLRGRWLLCSRRGGSATTPPRSSEAPVCLDTGRAGRADRAAFRPPAPCVVSGLACPAAANGRGHRGRTAMSTS